MNLAEIFVCSFVFLIQHVFVESGSSLARGFNDNIDWKNMEDGMSVARQSNKPIMMLIHKSWCGACKALKKKFTESQEIEKLSSSFVMINIQDEEEPSDKKYTPDGGYIPRILFMDPNGQIQTNVVNAGGSPEYKFYYPDPSAIVSSMQGMLARYGGGTGKPTDEL